MIQECVVAEFPDMEKAKVVLEVLYKSDFEDEEVLCVSSDQNRDLQQLGKLQPSLPGDPKGGATTGMGAVIGGAVTIPIMIGTLMVPFMVIGPAVGAGIGAVLGGAMTRSRQFQIDHESIQNYETRVQQGAVLVIVTGEADDLHEAEASLQTVGPTSMKRFTTAELSEHSQAADRSPDL